MVEWLPIARQEDSGLVDSLANDGACTLMDLSLEDPENGEDFPDGTIVGGRIDVYVYTTDGTALTAGRGPLIFAMYLLGSSGTAAAGPDMSQILGGGALALELKRTEKNAWMMTAAFLEGGATNVVHVRFDIRTLRRFNKGDRLLIYMKNRTGATLAVAGMGLLFGELYLQLER